MPLFYQHTINENAKLGIWEIKEPESFFLKSVPLQREITHPHKKLQHLAGRYLLKFLFPDFPYEEIVIADTRRPYLPYEQYHFSISHCGNFAAAIVSTDRRTGIDIEIPTEKILRISHKFLNEKEVAFIQQASFNIQLLTVIWAAKESVFKWWGWGDVDFSEHILLQPFDLHNEGFIDAYFIKEKETAPLQLQYKLFDELCLVWVMSAP